MDAESIRLLTFGLTVALGVVGPAIAIGWIGSAGLGALGRNPQAESKIRNTMILAITFAESLAIFALVSGFIVYFVK